MVNNGNTSFGACNNTHEILKNTSGNTKRKLEICGKWANFNFVIVCDQTWLLLMKKFEFWLIAFFNWYLAVPQPNLCHS